ncbi:MAG: matrixin family metalloprotease, partial [Betaproteobacteria bacterium]
MSAPGRPKREYRSAQRGGTPARAPGRPKREYRSAQREGLRGRAFALWALALLVAAGLAAHARAGGPLVVLNHQPVVYVNFGTSLSLNLDQGTLGARSNAQAVTLVQNAIALWNGVNTSTMRLSIGTQLSTDYTAVNYAGILNNSSDGVNPVLFDTDGSIIDDVFGAGAKNSILGFAGSNYFTVGPNAGHFSEGIAVLNGHLNVTDATMTIVLAHELGHYFGLDHAQLDDTQGLASNNYVLMYPIAFRTLVSLHEDDAAAATALYPSAGATASYGHLTGTFTTAGNAAILGANIWAKESVSGKVYSTVSDYLQNFTGAFDLSLPPGTYTLHAESIQGGFTGGSSVGPYAETGADVSFLPPHPIAPVALGGGTGQPIVMVAGCVATATFRLDGTGTVGGNCAAAAMPGTGTVAANPYGLMSVSGGTLVGTTISLLQPSATIQLGNTPGGPGSFAQINFQGFDVGANNILTIRSGAPGQTIVLVNVGPSGTSIGGLLRAISGGGAAPPVMYLRNSNGITVIPGGVVNALSGLIVDTLGNSNLVGQMLVNQGTIDGGSSLSLLSARVTGGGAFKGDATFLGTFGHANNPVSGAHFLSNGLQLSPSTGSLVALTLNLYGPAPQILNVQVNGNALVSMPSAWPG